MFKCSWLHLLDNYKHGRVNHEFQALDPEENSASRTVGQVGSKANGKRMLVWLDFFPTDFDSLQIICAQTVWSLGASKSLGFLGNLFNNNNSSSTSNNNQQPTTNNQQPTATTTNNQQPTTSNQQPTTTTNTNNNQQPTTTTIQPTNQPNKQTQTPTNTNKHQQQQQQQQH